MAARDNTSLIQWPSSVAQSELGFACRVARVKRSVPLLGTKLRRLSDVERRTGLPTSRGLAASTRGCCRDSSYQKSIPVKSEDVFTRQLQSGAIGLKGVTTPEADTCCPTFGGKCAREADGDTRPFSVPCSASFDECYCRYSIRLTHWRNRNHRRGHPSTSTSPLRCPFGPITRECLLRANRGHAAFRRSPAFAPAFRSLSASKLQTPGPAAEM